MKKIRTCFTEPCFFNSTFGGLKKLVLSFWILCFVFVIGIFREKNIPPVPTFSTIVEKVGTGGAATRSFQKAKTPGKKQRETAKKYTSELARVSRVIDGDTIELEDGERVRYVGINSPELRDKRERVGCFAAKAREANQVLVEGKDVRLQKDISERDKYGRLLRYVFIGDIFVNLEMIKQGFAYSATYLPDVKYQSQFLQVQNEAKKQKKGLWGSNC